MTATTRTTLAAVTTLLALSAWANAEEKGSWGRQLGEALRDANRRIQGELDRRPQVRQAITGGINHLADNLIDMVEPGADESARRVARSAVQMALNPSHTESDRAFA